MGKQYSKVCKKCSVEFFSRAWNAQVCSKCKDRSHRICKYCSNEFLVQSSSQYYCQRCRDLDFPCACGKCDQRIGFYKYISHGKRYAHGHNNFSEVDFNKKCVVCDVSIQYESYKRQRLTCSKKCQNKLNSKNAVARILRTGFVPGVSKRFKSERYNGHYFRSSWELALAKTLENQGYRYEYESKRFRLKSGVYITDFYLPDMNLYIEIKGWLRESFEDRMKELEELYPDINLIVVNRPPPYEWILG